MFSLNQWRGKVAVVTGASSGIGAAIVETLVKEGLEVVGLARRIERVQELAEKLSEEPGKLYAYQTDITNEDNIKAAFEWILENVGPVQILINNAGILINSNLLDGEIEVLRKTIDTNVIGLCIATSEAAKIMKANGLEGAIININSISGHFVPRLPNLNVYPATKHAVTAISKVLCHEFIESGDKIKVTSISPGIVATEIFETGNFKLAEGGPALNPQDIAAAVHYVLSTPSHVQIHELIIRPLGELIN